MTKKERRQCFQYAKKRVIAVVGDEMQSQAAMAQHTDRRDVTNRIEWDIEHFLREVRKIKFEDWVKI